MMPVIAFNLLRSIDMLGRACQTLAERCIAGISANREHCRQMVENSIGLVTALNPYIGYDRAAEIAKEAHKTGKTVKEVALAADFLPEEIIEAAWSRIYTDV